VHISATLSPNVTPAACSVAARRAALIAKLEAQAGVTTQLAGAER